VRNHLKSVHAIALANLAEMTTGLAVTISLKDNQRAILTDFAIKFLKKARGTVTSVCRFEVPTDFAEGDLAVPVELQDPAGVVVATATATWKIGLQ
jgi:acyl-coenzyme A thioesterase PaaI-like protein